MVSCYDKSKCLLCEKSKAQYQTQLQWRVHLTRVLGVADSERAPADLLFEQVLLVEEEDDGGEREPLVVADGVKKLHALVHPVLGREEGLGIKQTTFSHVTAVWIHKD